MPFGENNQHVLRVQLIDFENLPNNNFIAANQYKLTKSTSKIPDMVLLVNGIPVVVGELKPYARCGLLYLGWMARYKFMMIMKTPSRNFLCRIFFLCGRKTFR